MIFSFGKIKIDTKNIVCVLEIDHVTVTKRGRIMFSGRTDEKIIVTDEKNLPLSAVVVCENSENTIFLTPLTPLTLLKHMGAEKSKESDDMYIWW